MLDAGLGWQALPPIIIDMVVEELLPLDGLWTGAFYGDASAYIGASALLRRVGWGLCLFEEGGVKALLHGPAPGMQQDVPFAESYAFLMALRRCQGPPFFFGTDCKFMIGTFAKGAEFWRSGWFVYAGIWAQLWNLVEDIGGIQEITLRKLKARTSRSSAVLRE